MNHTIKNSFYTLTVSEMGAELTSLVTSDGKELIWQSSSEKFWSKHAPLLFPVCGRLKDSRYSFDGKIYDMSAHGFVMKTRFDVAEKNSDSITLVLHSNEETKAVYPFDFTLVAHYSLLGSEIKFSATVTNEDKKIMPYMFGWHPGFALPTDGKTDIESYCLDFNGKKSLSWIPLQNEVFARPYGEEFPLKNGKYLISEKQIYENDTMIFEGHENALSMYAEGQNYRLDISWSDNLPYLCIWKDPDNAAKYLCIEPWSNVPGDGFEDENFNTRKMLRLQPQSSEEFIYSFRFDV